MDTLIDIAQTLFAQLQKPTLAFLIGGMVLAALNSKLRVPEQVYQFIVLLLLLKIGLGAGLSVRQADLVALAVPAALAALVGIAIVLLGTRTLARTRGVKPVDGMATAGLFGAVSASTLAAGMAVLETEGVPYEAFIGALYPFMDMAALLTAILLARLATARASQPQGDTLTLGGGTTGGLSKSEVGTILADTVKSPAISALLLGLALGLLGDVQPVFESFYEPLFRGLLSLLMLTMGMEAWSRLSDLRGAAPAYLAYGLLAPLVHGLLGFGAGLIAHELTGFSVGGIVLLAVMASSSSDISGPPTLRGSLPEANPSAYVGTSTGLGTPVAILSIPLWLALAQAMVD